MTRCAVCGRDGARRLDTSAGEYLGTACEGECVGLLWEAHFVRATGGDDAEQFLVLWRWQRRRAEVAGRPFTTKPPKSTAEVALDKALDERDLLNVAKELE